MFTRTCARESCHNVFETDIEGKLYCERRCGRAVSKKSQRFNQRVRKRYIAVTTGQQLPTCLTPQKRFFVTQFEADQFRKSWGIQGQKAYSCPCGYWHNKTIRGEDGSPKG